MKKLNIIPLLSLFCFLFSCGDINDGQWFKDQVLDRRFASADCELDSESFSKFAEKDISEDIDCAYEQIDLLLDLTARENLNIPGKNISKKTLKSFLTQLLDDSDDIVDFLDPFFQFNSFLFNKEENYLVKSDLKSLRDLLIFFNKKSIQLNDFLDDEEISLAELSNNSLKFEKLLKETLLGSNNSFLEVMNRNKELRSLDLNKLVKNLGNLFDSKQLEKIDSLRFVKKIFFGGNDNELSNFELSEFLSDKIKDYSFLFYTAYKISDLKESDDLEKYKLYEDLLFASESLIKEEVETKEKLNLEDLVEVLGVFKDEILGQGSTLEVSKYKHEILRVKEIFIGNALQSFNTSDLKRIISEGKVVLDKFISFSEIYKANENYLNNHRGAISNPSLLNNPVDSKRFKEFGEIVKKQRYFKGSDVLAYYGNQRKRNLAGINEMGLFYYALEKVIPFYERNHPCDKKNQILVNKFTKEASRLELPDSYLCDREDNALTLKSGQLYLIIMDFKNLLYESKIVKKTREESSAENAASLPDLFLETANDNGKLEVAELSEFFSTLFSVIPMKDKVFSYFEDKCGVIDNIPEFGGNQVDVKCVRKHFLDVFENIYQENNKTFSYYDYMPKLKKVLKAQENRGDKHLNDKYVMLIENYSRGCGPYENIPYNSFDLVGMYTGLLNIEATMNKFDKNGNNIIDPDEAEETYEHFKPGLLNVLDGIAKKVPKQIFKFLLKYKRMPDPKKDWFKVLTTFKMPSADRETIVTILVGLQTVGDQKRRERQGDDYLSKGAFCQNRYKVKTLIRDQYECVVNDRQEFCN